MEKGPWWNRSTGAITPVETRRRSEAFVIELGSLQLAQLLVGNFLFAREKRGCAISKNNYSSVAAVLAYDQEAHGGQK